MRFFRALVCGWWLLGSTVAHAAATFGTVATVRVTGETALNSLLVNVTCTNSNTALYVGVHIREVNSTITTVTALTYNGLTLTDFTIVGNNTSPDTGTRIVTLTVFRALPGAACDGAPHSMTVTLSATRQWGFGAISVTGVNQSDPEDPAVTTDTNNTPAVNPASGNVSSQTDDLVLGFAVIRNSEAITSDQTERYDQFNTIADASLRETQVGATAAGAATVNMSWTMGGAQEWVAMGINVNQVTTARKRQAPRLMQHVPSGQPVVARAALVTGK